MSSPTTPHLPHLPFFVYGTLRPGEVNHDRFLRDRTLHEHPARLPGAVLYDGPGYPYAVEEPGGVMTSGVTASGPETGGTVTGGTVASGPETGGTVAGELVTARPEAYDRLLAELDRLEEYTPGDPRNLYERVEREVVVLGADRIAVRTAVRAWVYVAAPAVAARLRARGKLLEGGDWLARR
ncbi:gamma-glutamylcyclotransferase [Streptomyces sp. NBC_01275]|uniref:gamma-glutamylcyclotransferase family protein n=1 Tax=Streptomyces sp. NBC_01275 TaxID=2903807 RepID=UPI0022503DBB|nr:gamma-glutamylcyclotransferase family protein [Streptomyces sp. NBC_01275]MCX4761978.1 gamma-glutamylcyclotransferase [Streptomyces sp. NBC_01275]